MLSSLLCQSDEELQSYCNGSPFERVEKNKSELDTDNKVRSVQFEFSGGNRRLAYLLFVFVLLAGSYIQCE